MEKNSPGPAVRQVSVTGADADRRLDNFLLSQLKGVPRSRVYRMIRSGEVRVNKGRAGPDRRLQAGDVVRIPPVRTGAAAPGPDGDSIRWLEQRIRYEDRDLLVLDKPAGLAVHGGSGISFGVIEMLRALRRGPDAFELAHRLDRDTSGCLLIAKRRPALRHLHALFRDAAVQKRYAALLLGAWDGGRRVVDAPLLTTHRRNGERHVCVSGNGKPARTVFRPERRFDGATLMAVELDTGRTHQIRAHAAHIGHPVAGDRRYGPDDDPVVAATMLDRLFLHAASLEFTSPRDGRIIRVESPLDEKLLRVLSALAPAD